MGNSQAVSRIIEVYSKIDKRHTCIEWNLIDFVIHLRQENGVAEDVYIPLPSAALYTNFLKQTEFPKEEIEIWTDRLRKLDIYEFIDHMKQASWAPEIFKENFPLYHELPFLHYTKTGELCNIYYFNDPIEYQSLFDAIYAEDENQVQQLLEDDSDEDFNTIENDAGYSPLHCAIQVDNVPIIKMLLEHTDNPFYFSDYGEQSPVHTAIIHHSHNALRFLLEFDNQPYPYDDDGQTLFELAILHNDLESVKILYELVPGYCFSSCVNFEVDTWDVCDCIEVTSPMCLAARNGSLEIVQFLVGIEISPNRHCYGTALYNAVLYSHIEIVKFLFANERESGTRLERRGITMADNFQNDLLKVALDNGNFEMVKLLIENDVPVSTLVNCKEIYDLTAEIPGLCAAFENQCDRPTQEIYDMISYVLDEMENKGCKISFGDDQEKEGLVHLQFACMYGTLPLVQRVNQFIEASIEKDVIREANDNKDHGTEILIWIIDRVLRQESKTLLELHESGMENGAVARYLVLKYGDTMHNGEKSLFGEQFNIFYKEIVEMKHKLRNCRKFFDIEIVIDTTREKRKREEEHEPNKRIKL